MCFYVTNREGFPIHRDDRFSHIWDRTDRGLVQSSDIREYIERYVRTCIRIEMFLGIQIYLDSSKREEYRGSWVAEWEECMCDYESREPSYTLLQNMDVGFNF